MIIVSQFVSYEMKQHACIYVKRSLFLFLFSQLKLKS